MYAICQRFSTKLDQIGNATFKVERRFTDYRELLTP